MTIQASLRPALYRPPANPWAARHSGRLCLLIEAAHETKWSLWVILSKNDAGTPAILSELQPGRLGGDFEFKLVFVDSMPDDLADRLRPFASLRPSLGTVGDTPLVLITGPGGEVQGTGSISAAEDVVAFVEEGRRRGIIASTPR